MMRSKRTTLAPILAAVGGLVASVLALAAPPPNGAPPDGATAPPAATPPAKSPKTAAPVNQQPEKISVVFRQPRVEVPVKFLIQGNKALPAGSYDITLVNLEYSDGTQENAFEFRRPNGDDLLGTLRGVKAGVMPPRSASQLMGVSGKGRRKGRAAGAAGAPDAGAGAPDAGAGAPDAGAGAPGEGYSAAAAAGSSDHATGADTPKNQRDPSRPKHDPILVAVMGSELKVSYWARTELGTIRVLSASAPIQPGS